MKARYNNNEYSRDFIIAMRSEQLVETSVTLGLAIQLYFLIHLLKHTLSIIQSDLTAVRVSFAVLGSVSIVASSLGLDFLTRLILKLLLQTASCLHCSNIEVCI